MSIASQISRIQSAKTDIKTAIEAKGVTVPSNALIDTYPSYISAIPTGGGGDIDGYIEGTITSVSYSGSRIRDYAFYQFQSLTTVTSPNLTSVGKYAFQYCYSLTSINLSLVRNTGEYCFAECKNLTSVNLPVLTSLSGNVFLNCSRLTSISLPVLTSVAGNAFKGCTALTSLSLPSLVSLGYGACVGCSSLATFTLPSTVTKIQGYTFASCTSLASLYIASDVNKVIPLDATTAFNGTKIAAGTGNIYVPSSWLASYQTANIWSTYSNVMIGY